MPVDISKSAQSTLPLVKLTAGTAIEDAFTSEDKDKPITGGLFTVDQADEPLLYKYGYHELKIILEGEIWLEVLDEEDKKGEVIKAVAGDVLRIHKGTHIKFTSPNHGKGGAVSNVHPMSRLTAV